MPSSHVEKEPVRATHIQETANSTPHCALDERVSSLSLLFKIAVEEMVRKI
jgi:hypothetical protein